MHVSNDVMTDTKGMLLSVGREESVVRRRRARTTVWLSRVISAAGLLAAIASCLPATATAGALSPGGRAYEMVSPPEKAGIDPTGDPSNTHVGVDGDSLEFPAIGGFADVAGTGAATDYISVRTGTAGTNGWTTHAITPPQQPSSFLTTFVGDFPRYQGDFSPDLSKGVFRAISPLTDAPNVAQAENLYVRSGLLTGLGSSDLLTDSVSTVPPPPANALAIPTVADASTDFTHILFESVLRLTADAPPCTDATDPVYGCGPLLYEWDDGELKLAGILPDGSAAVSSIAGRGAAQRRYTQHTISADGSRVFFTDDESGQGSENGALYMRTNETSTVQINASERTDCADHDPCSGTSEPDPAGAQPAQFGDATPDGSEVVFLSGEQLTDTAGSGLYRYDVNGATGHHLTLLASDVFGMIGTSSDGSYVYFITNSREIKLWHGGALRTVGVLASGGDPSGDVFPEHYSLGLKASRVSPSGRFMVFSATNGSELTGYDHGTCDGVGCSELYEYDATANNGAGMLRCVSCRPDGLPATSDASSVLQINFSALGPGSHLSTFLADDGEVYFSTGERLVLDDVNGSVRDVYEYDAATGKVQLISTGHSAFDSYFLDASPDGKNVFFYTREPLVGWDIDQNYDIYDARRGGGVPDPVPGAVPCSGEACQPPPSLAPGDQIPGTATFTGGTDASPIGVFRLVPLHKRDLTRASRSGTLTARVEVSEKGLVRATLSARYLGRWRLAGAASKHAGRGETVGLSLRLSRGALRALAASGHLRTRLSVRYSENPGTTESVEFVLKRARR
jgi:hypothetical protein